jgi:hypothetical protein
MSGLFTWDEFTLDFLAEVSALDGRIGLANFARVLARCEELAAPPAPGAKPAP